MRLRETVHFLESYNSLEPKFTQLANHSPVVFQLSNKTTITRALSDLLKVDALSADVQLCLEHPALHAITDSSGKNSATARLLALRTDAERMWETISTCVGEESPLTLSIQIPDANTLKELTEITSKLGIVFEAPAQRFFGPGDGTPAFDGFDVGSQWIRITFTSIVALNFAGTIINEAQRIQLEAVRYEATVATSESMGLGVEALTQLKDAQLKTIEAMVQTSAECIAKEHAGQTNQDPATQKEAAVMISQAIKTWGELVIDGAQAVHALSPSPEDSSLRIENIPAQLVEVAKVKGQLKSKPDTAKD